MATADGNALTLALAAEVKRLRSERGWSQEALADEAGVHRTFIGLFESGRRGISVAKATAVAAALGVTLSHLVSQAETRLASGAGSGRRGRG